jgi:nucleoside-diphosphate-sugar epimerase
VDDAATACLVAAEALVSGRAESGFEVPIATGVATTLRAAATLAADAVGVHGFSYNFEGHARAGDVNPQMLVGTTESAERLIGWSPSTSLRDGLRQTASELGLPVADATAEEVRSAELRKSGNESP